ncbi:MBL fold metallo-hydrolase [Anaerocolumna sp. MB42-C2]|uniref:MBL fold metallo-hydrolase n=1 Tax=Anaerocolumna sp. MB42-C2 TaxID=3070997 RepID=UPI0027E0814F|nr:MBL fold metallo-hydrolase [Anaerocolumna sp. MB42-C2]WMJ88492.1 MBL fold metallo-hydrolase [Anaerocolumna sp. MB42-C2]
MEFIITGSGGCVCTPRPLCGCKVCKEARLKGYPYARCGCSLVLKDINLLIDTPEDIVHGLNHCDINAIDYILYSHLDPDHTLGLRVIEQLRLDWLSMSVGIRCKDPIKVMALPIVMEDINAIHTKYGSIMEYYKSMNLIVREQISDAIIIEDIKITLLPVNSKADVTIFLFEQNNKKLIYAPCDVKPFPKNKLFDKADYLIIGNTIVGDMLKDGFRLEKDNGLRKELFTLDEILELQNYYNIKKVIITHLEEDWGKTYEDYQAMEKNYKNVFFAYDNMRIHL